VKVTDVMYVVMYVLTGVWQQSQSAVCFVWKSEHCAKWKGTPSNILFATPLVCK